VDSDRERTEAELRRNAELGRTAGPSAGAPGHRVERASQDATRQASRRGTREALDEKEQEESGGGGLYGSQIDASHLVGAAIAELVGTFILVFGGTAVAVGATLARPTAGPAYDSLAVALAFGLALAAVVAAVGHVSGRTSTRPSRSGWPRPASSPGTTRPYT
jgi:hypothetical protein